MKKNKILVTGATGFVGSNLTRRLISEGFEVNILTRENSNKWRLEGIANLKEHVVDLKERERLFKIVKKIKPKVIFHLATQGVYGGISSDNKELIDANFLGTINLIEACENVDYACFVNTGSSSEYGIKNKPMKEYDVCSPDTMYGITKNAATQFSQLVAKTKNKPIISFRLFSPYGPFDDKRRLIPTVILRALKNQEINLTNANIGRDFIFIDDIINLYLKSIKKAEELMGEIFNIGSGIQTKLSDIVENVMKITKSKSKIRWGAINPRIYDTEIWVANIEKTKKTFNWEPKYSLAKGLEETIEWFNYNLKYYL